MSEISPYSKGYEHNLCNFKRLVCKQKNLHYACNLPIFQGMYFRNFEEKAFVFDAMKKRVEKEMVGKHE